MSATVLLLSAALISIHYCVGLTHEESVELLEKYNIGHLWYALEESKYDISLWQDIDQDMLKNMNVLDSDRLRFKKLQNELKQQNQSNWTNRIVVILNSAAAKVVASIVAFIAMIFTKYKEMKACFASLFPMNKRETDQIHTPREDTPNVEETVSNTHSQGQKESNQAIDDETKTTPSNSLHNTPPTLTHDDSNARDNTPETIVVPDTHSKGQNKCTTDSTIQNDSVSETKRIATESKSKRLSRAPRTLIPKNKGNTMSDTHSADCTDMSQNHSHRHLVIDTCNKIVVDMDEKDVEEFESTEQYITNGDSEGETKTQEAQDDEDNKENRQSIKDSNKNKLKLDQLEKLGYKDRTKNLGLLKMYGGDVNLVIQDYTVQQDFKFKLQPAKQRESKPIMAEATLKTTAQRKTEAKPQAETKARKDIKKEEIASDICDSECEQEDDRLRARQLQSSDGDSSDSDSDSSSESDSDLSDSSNNSTEQSITNSDSEGETKTQETPDDEDNKDSKAETKQNDNNPNHRRKRDETFHVEMFISRDSDSSVSIGSAYGQATESVVERDNTNRNEGKVRPPIDGNNAIQWQTGPDGGRYYVTESGDKYYNSTDATLIYGEDEYGRILYRGVKGGYYFLSATGQSKQYVTLPKDIVEAYRKRHLKFINVQSDSE